MGERFDFSAANLLKSSLSDFPLHFLMMNEASCSKAPPKQPPRRLTVESSTQLAPGYRFHPTDEELVSYYLKRKVSGKRMVDVISEVELYKAEPWDLPARSRLQSGDLEWYFFTSLDRKYSNCCRTNRATRATTKGYWKTTGIDRPVQRGSRTIGKKKTLVYHAGRAPHGQRTNWVMHEYRLDDEDLTRAGIPQDGYVVCRIFEKNGPGPQNGAQYGAPFKEEEWDMEEEEEDAELVPVDVDRVDALLDHADPDFFTLEDFFQNPDTGYQNLDAFPSESRSAEHQFDSRTEDSYIFVDEILKALDSFDDRIPDADFSAPQSINSALNRLGEMEGPEDQSICASLQSNGYVQLEDILVEDNPNPSSDACSNHCLWDIGHNHSVGDGISPSKSLFQKQVEEESCYTNCSLDQLQLCGTVQHDMFPQPFDSSDIVLWEYPSAEDNSIFYDALNHEVPYSEGGFGLETSLAPLADFELSKDLIAYHNASDDNLIYGSPNLLPSKFEQAYSLECIEPNDSLEVVGSSSSSYKEVLHENLVLQSSSGKPQTGDDFSSVLNDNLTDAKLNEPQDKTLSKRLASMLNSISAPPAFADEAALIGKTARQVPAASGGELRLTVGRIQIGNWMAMDYSESWTLRKHTDVGFYHSYGVDGSIVGKSGGRERRGKVLGRFYSTFCSDGFHLFFISAVILGFSCKIGQLLGGLLD